jgi:hypothetical protein
MRPNHLRVLLGGLSALAAAACQPTQPPQTATEPVPGASKPFRDRKGWEVTVVEPSATVPIHCRGIRSPQNMPDIAFFSAEAESGFVVTGAPVALAEGTTDRLTARFDTGEPRGFDARVVGGGAMEVRFPTQRYDETFLPLARARTVTLTGQKAGDIGAIDLVGSSWAVNATDECRRMNVKK